VKFLIQRVESAAVVIDETEKARIGRGLLVFMGVTGGDDEKTAERMKKKLLGMRIFADENGKTNLSIKDVGGSLLVVSQFTLYADCRHGNRPGFTDAGDPKRAKELYEYLVSECKKEITDVQTGQFGADMKVSLVNDGPFTIMLDSSELPGG
jgi:D-tyrosyl-tRNA(Tyr) deacylase